MSIIFLEREKILNQRGHRGSMNRIKISCKIKGRIKSGMTTVVKAVMPAKVGIQ